MLTVGLTGNFGAGKSTVAAMFKARGAEVLDADELAHGLLAKNAACQREVVRAFGKDLLTSSGIDRRALGKIVFNDPAALKKLESILHPRLHRLIAALIKASRKRLVIVEAALLVEAGWDKLVDTVVLVKARREVQIERAMARTGLSRADILKRIRRQMPLSAKQKYAAYVIDNSGKTAATEQHVERIFRSLTQTPIQQE